MKLFHYFIYHAVINDIKINSRRALRQKCVFICCLELDNKIKRRLLETVA